VQKNARVSAVFGKILMEFSGRRARLPLAGAAGPMTIAEYCLFAALLLCLLWGYGFAVNTALFFLAAFRR
jgi:hypothetical protein